MLIAFIMSPLWALINLIISLLPNTPNVTSSFNSILPLLSNGLYFFGSSFFCFLIGNFVFWLSAQFIWSIIEWIYIKIPGVS